MLNPIKNLLEPHCIASDRSLTKTGRKKLPHNLEFQRTMNSQHQSCTQYSAAPQTGPEKKCSIICINFEVLLCRSEASSFHRPALHRGRVSVFAFPRGGRGDKAGLGPKGGKQRIPRTVIALMLHLLDAYTLCIYSAVHLKKSKATSFQRLASRRGWFSAWAPPAVAGGAKLASGPEAVSRESPEQ